MTLSMNVEQFNDDFDMLETIVVNSKEYKIGIKHSSGFVNTIDQISKYFFSGGSLIFGIDGKKFCRSAPSGMSVIIEKPFNTVYFMFDQVVKAHEEYLDVNTAMNEGEAHELALCSTEQVYRRLQDWYNRQWKFLRVSGELLNPDGSLTGITYALEIVKPSYDEEGLQAAKYDVLEHFGVLINEHVKSVFVEQYVWED